MIGGESGGTTAELVERYRKETTFARLLSEPAPVSRSILVACIALYVALHGLAVYLSQEHFPGGIGYPAMLVFGAKLPETGWGGAWRLISSQFLHVGLLHLAFNGYAIYVLGPILERLYGRARFLGVYLGSGLCGGIASYYFSPAPSVGASGAIFGLLGAAMVFGIKFRDWLPPRLARMLVTGLLPWVVLNLLIGFAIPKIDNAAHIGGLVGGAVLALLTGAEVRDRGARVVTRRIVATAAIALLAYGGVRMGAEVVRCGRGPSAMEACYAQYEEWMVPSFEEEAEDGSGDGEDRPSDD